MASKKCTKCFQVLSINNFTNKRISKNGKPVKAAVCKSCNNKLQNYWRNCNLPSFLYSSFLKLRGHAKDRNIVFALEFKDVVDLYLLQNGRCFYTDKDMSWGNDIDIKTSLSYDKIVPELGYINGNVVLCCKRINTIKSDLTLEELKQYIPSWYERIERKLNAKQA